MVGFMGADLDFGKMGGAPLAGSADQPPAPNLTSPTGSSATDTSASLSVSTDTGNGTLYWVVTASATLPSVAQIQAGQDNTGAAAPASGNQAVSATGTQNATATGLTAGATYFVHFQQKGSNSANSTVDASSSWTQTGGFDAATIAWVNAVNTAAGSSVVGNTNKTIVDTLIKALKTDSSGNLFTLNDRLWLLALANESSFEAQVDIIGLQSWTQHGSSNTLNANGFAGDGSTGFLDTGYISSSSGSMGVANASMSVAIFNNRTTNANVASVSVTGANGAQSGLNPNAFGNTNFWQLNGTTQLSASATTSKGFMLCSLTSTGASGTAAYLNGSSVATGSGASGTLPNSSFYIGGQNNAGTLAQASTDQIVAVHFGQGMTSTQANDFATIVNNALGSLSKNVF